jgi:4-diphosphocytidyl-2-C-methyl-D-erythritol kinase
MTAAVLRSPAKINWFLEVLGRRTDGYHEIVSVMQLVDLCDEVTLHPRRRGIRVTVSGAELPEGPGNLAHRAAALLLEAAGCPEGVAVHLTKRIPVAGGLGGGSSNAAAVLIGLNRLYGLGWTLPALRTLAEGLGSDIPFFFTEGLALSTGRGEALSPLPAWAPQWLVLANAGQPVSTAWAYGEVSSKLTAEQGQVTLPPFTGTGGLPWPPVWAFNRFEAVVLPHRPEIGALKSLLQQGGGAPVLMSGSGGSVFAVVPDAAAAARLAASVTAAGAFAAAAMTLASNPLTAPVD